MAAAELRRLVSGQVTRPCRTVTDTVLLGSFHSPIHDVRYGLSWGFLIEATETGERAPIPYRWEQIGSKQVTSSQMQLWSAHHAAKVADER
jgi:hypothetical protein